MNKYRGDMMKLCKVEDLKGGEILAKAILTSELRILLSDETILHPEYIEKIKEFGISEVYIKEEEQVRGQEVVLLKSEVENFFHNKVKSILEKHTYSKNEELMELSQTADHIIASIMEENEVVEKIYDIKERSADLYEHSINICSLATLVALKMNYPKEKVHDIGVGCLLHDLGLRYLTLNYMDQNVFQLPKMELTEFMKHPVYGYSVLKDEKWISQVGKNIILYHHESLDGLGYPLHAKEIPFEAQIVGVCDCFDEMICGIGCKRIKVHEAVEYLKNCRKVKYNAEIVNVFLEFTAVYPVGSRILLSNNTIGTVIKQNKEYPDRPIIQVVENKALRRQKIIDLAEVNHIFIEKVLE